MPAPNPRTITPSLLSTLGTYTRMAQRQAVPIALCSAIGLGLGIAYFVSRVPTFTATSTLLIDTRKVRAVQDAYAFTGQGESFDMTVSNQIEVLRSEKITRWVLGRLPADIGADPAHAGRGPIGHILAKLLSPLSAGADDAQRAADAPDTQRRLLYGQLRENLWVRRVGRTPLVLISFSAVDAARAARVANTYAEAFVAEQTDAQIEAATRASQWLRGQLDELKQAVQKSELAAQKYKAEQGLVSAGGRLVDDQKLSESTGQLTTLRSETLRLEARYAKVKEALASNRLDPAIAEASANSTIELNRAKYLAAEKGEREMSRRLGAGHATVQRLRAEMQDYRRLTLAELNRLSESLRNEIDIAKAREKSALEQYNMLAGVTSTTNETLVELRELERTAEIYKSIYTSALQRNQEALQQQSFPVADVRVLGRASAPESPGGISLPATLVYSLLLGSLGGLAIGALRELKDDTFRSKQQTASLLMIEPVHMLPKLDGAAHDGLEHLDYAAAHPRSQFAESLQSLKVSMARPSPDMPLKTIGVVSVLPGEGTTTIARNLAGELARMGSRTLLIDADLRAPSLSQALAPAARRGLQDCAAEGAIGAASLVKDPASGLDFLPVASAAAIPAPLGLLTAAGFAKVLQQARSSYDYVIIDLPALAVCSDASAVAPAVDGILLVVEWGQTSARLTSEVLASHDAVHSKCVGVLLNKTDWPRLKSYESYDPQIDYLRKYGAFRAGPSATSAR